MKVDRKLNLVVPVERDDGTTVHVHATPISRETFHQHFLTMAKAFSSIYTNGLGITAGPRVAALMIRKVAADIGPNELTAVESGLMAEMKRLSSVIVPNNGGWLPMPLDEAIAREVITADDADEVENAIAFFILASAMHKRAEAAIIVDEAVKLWSASTTSLSSTAFAGSLGTSTPPVSSGAKATQSSIPS